MAAKKKVTKKPKKSLKTTARKKTKPVKKSPTKMKKRTPRKPAKKAAQKKPARRKKAAGKTSVTKTTARQIRKAFAKRVIERSQTVDTASSRGRRERRLSGQQSGDLQGLSRAEGADSESVDELLEEGNAFEAAAVAGVESADLEDGREVRTHEVPEDDVPEEYLDTEYLDKE